MARHALLSPSSSKRWLNCTPSAMLESLEPFQASSTYAEEGSEAHFLSELKLSFMLEKISHVEYDLNFEGYRLGSKYYNAEFNDFVNDYCNEVMAIIKEDYAGRKIEVYLEQQVEFTDVVPEGSGTADVVIVGTDFVHIIDLKFGKGVPVSAVDNSQLMLYALGALKKFRLNGVFNEVVMTIIQPRLYDKSTVRMPVVELYQWANDYVKPRAELAYAGKGQLTPGDHCGFCKLKGKCDARAQLQLELAQKQFEEVVQEDQILEPQNMTPEMLAKVLTIGPAFSAWLKDVTAYAMSAMINQGLKVPGYKIVEGRSNRVITDGDAVYDILRFAGFSDEQLLHPKKLLGITTLEKNVGKKVFNALAKDYIIKPFGKLTLATEDDPRQALDGSQLKLMGQEFEEDESGE